MVTAMINEIDNDNEDLLQHVYGYNNGVAGLALCLNSLYGNMFEIDSYRQIGNSYSGVLKFTFYYHFGLDTSDLAEEKYGHMKAEIYSWFSPMVYNATLE